MVIKRDGRKVEFDKNKIIKAMESAYKEIRKEEGLDSFLDFAKEVADDIERKSVDYSVEEIQDIIENKLMASRYKDIAKAYIIYRNKRTNARENTIDKTIDGIIERNDPYWVTENSNKNAMLETTVRDYLAGAVSTDKAKRHLLPSDIVEAHNKGIIHFHDMDYFIQHIYNCCLINLEDMLQNGTVISGTYIDKPHKFSTACNIATQIIAQVASSQYGGQTISLAHLSPFVEETRNTIRKKHPEYSEAMVEELTMDDIKAGVQTIQYQVVTLMTTNGQAPFITVYMNLDEIEEGKGREDLALVIEETLKQRILGVKNEKGVYVTPAFPKLIYALDEINIHEDSKYFYLTELAAKCTAKRMVPDFESNKIMKELKEGDKYPCMGCLVGNEIITYRYNNRLYVESFERAWDRLSDNFEIKEQSEGSRNLYIDVEGVEIYDTEKGFVNVSRFIRNWSNNWIDVHFSNGRRLLCTTDHPFEIIDKGVVRAEDLIQGDSVLINSNQYSEDRVFFDKDKAWMLGFLLCDGCYSGGSIFASIAARQEDDIRDKFFNSVKKCFGLSCKEVLRQRGIKGNYKDLIIKSDGTNKVQKTISYLNRLFGGSNKKYRHIPNEVFEWTIDAKYAFLAGMIDADGYISTKNNRSRVSIGSTNKELALQQMALAQALGMPAKMYYNHYSKSKPEAIRYGVSFVPDDILMSMIVCEKKIAHYIENDVIGFNTSAKVEKITKISDYSDYSYDVTTDSEHFEVSGVYSHNCRSFLTPDRTKENYARALNYDKYKGHKYYGRFNQGVVTINLPYIALLSGKDENKFWELMNEYIELCHKALQYRHKRLVGTVSDVAPILWQHGAIARLEKGEQINELLLHGYSTISLGYAGVYEMTRYMTGESHMSSEKGRDFAMKVMKYLNDKCTKWKTEEDIDYSVYGTPIESVTYKFAQAIQRDFGNDIEEVTNYNYITNSYHCNVREPIDAFSKLSKEAQFQNMSPGGAISYIEVPNMQNNIPAVLDVIKFIYNNIMYAELNTKSDYCQVCGYDGEIKIEEEKETGKLYWKCPNCGNKDQNKMNVARRTCGYIGTQFWNQGRTQEIRDRVLHL